MKIILLTFFTLYLFSAPSEWITYTAKDGSFKIKFPGQPKEMNMDPGYEVNHSQILQNFLFDKTNPEEGAAFSLTINSLSDEILKPNLNEKQLFELNEKYASSQIALIGKITETTKVTFSGYPGIIIRGKITQAVNEGPSPQVILKSYLVKNKLYILKVTASPINLLKIKIMKLFSIHLNY